MPEIGETLREARMRAKIDVNDVEAATKIRAKYLRALENEEWGLLPGPAFVKSFLRTYADYLGLDGKLLVDEYKLRHERPTDLDQMPIEVGGPLVAQLVLVHQQLAVQPEIVGVRPQERFDERGPREEPPLLVLEGAQVLGADL